MEWAAAEASVRGVPLRIVHVVAHEPSIDIVAGNIYTYGQKDRDAATNMLEEMALRARAIAPHLEVGVQLLSGSTARVLRRSTGDASLLVVGRNPARRRWSSPLPDRLARHTRVALAVVGLDETAVAHTSAANQHAARVLLVLDDTAFNQAALASAFAAAQQRGTDLVLVHQQRLGHPPRLQQQLTTALRRCQLDQPSVRIRRQRTGVLQPADLRTLAAGAALVLLTPRDAEQPTANPRGRSRPCLDADRPRAHRIAPPPELIAPPTERSDMSQLQRFRIPTHAPVPQVDPHDDHVLPWSRPDDRPHDGLPLGHDLPVLPQQRRVTT